MSPSNQLNTNHYKRRDLLKAAGIVAAGGALGLPQRTQAETTTGDKPRITIAGYNSYDRIAALAAGRVAVEGFDHTF